MDEQRDQEGGGGTALAGVLCGPGDSLASPAAGFWVEFDKVPIAAAEVSLEGRYIRVNQAMCDLFRYEQHDLVGRSVLELTIAEHRRKAETGLSMLTSGTTTARRTKRPYRLGDGSERWIATSAVTLPGHDGRPERLLKIYFDLDDRVRAAMTAEAAERDARQIAELSPDGVWLTDENGLVVYANPALATLLGFRSPEQAIGIVVEDCFAPASLETRRARLDAVLAGATVRGSVETLTRCDGTPVTVEVTSVAVERSDGRRVLSVMHDVSQRAAREAELVEAQARHRALFEYAPIGQALVGLDGSWLTVNPALCAMFDASPEAFAGRTRLDFTHPDDHEVGAEQFALIVAGVIDSYSVDKRYVRPDGSVIWGSLSVSSVRDATGQVEYLVSQIQDVTGRRARQIELESLNRQLEQVVAALEAANAGLESANAHQRQLAAHAATSEARLRALVDHLPDTVSYVYDRDGQIRVAAGAAIAARDLDPEELTGQTAEAVLAPDDAGVIGVLLERAFAGDPVTGEEVTMASTGITNLVDVVAIPGPDGQAVSEALVVARDISSLKARERALEAAEAKWRAAFDLAPVGMTKVDEDGWLISANQAVADLVEASVAELIGTHFLDYVPDEFRDGAAGRIYPLLRGEARGDSEDRIILTRRGNRRWVNLHSSHLGATDDAPAYTLFHFRDVTDIKRTSDKLSAAYARFSALVEHSSDVTIVTDSDGTVSYVSPAMYDMLNLAPEDVLGTTIRDRYHPDDLAHAAATLADLDSTPGALVSYQTRIRHADRSWRHIEVTASNHLDDPAIAGVVSNARDITERVEAAALLAHQAMHDTLTDLPNRALLLDRLTGALARATRSGRQCAVMFLDLDRFKDINDTFGHAIGDTLLTTVAGRLTSAVRPGDSVARMGGDEFVVLAEGVDTPDIALAIAERVLSSLAEPVALAGKTVSVSASVGVALSANHSATGLLQEADMALYQAKRSGRNRWELYDQAMRQQARRRFEISELLRSAAHGPALEVHYQPLIDLASRRVVGSEALARLRDGAGELVQPDQFITVAEETGLIVELGAAVLDRACRHTASLTLGQSDHQVAVNVSAHQLADPTFVDQVAACLAVSGLPPDRLCLELTETALIDAGASTASRLHDLKALGVSLAIDDFGTGWSSLVYLRRFPIDTLKIDRTFIAGLGVDHDDTELVKAVIGIGRAL